MTNSSSGGGQNLSLALSGNTVCVANGGGGWVNQEWHQGGPTTGGLIDYKKGAADPIDPTKQVGSWTISGTDQSSRVTYSYAGGGTFNFAVCSSKSQPGVGDTIGFCTNATSSSIVSATIEAGASACH